MLKHLNIKNFAIIEDLECDFADGFIALTGETGAGKSIIIDALSLLTGERSSFDKIRNGKQKAFIEGVFEINSLKNKKAIEELIDDEIEDEFILSRTIDIGGKTSIKANGRAITIATLKDIAAYLINIHSQQKDASYLKEDHQLFLLDEYAKKINNSLSFNAYQSKYQEYLNILKEILNLDDSKDKLGDLDYLEYEKKELEKVNIQENEMEDLESEKEKLASFSKITERLQTFLDSYSEASKLLYSAKKALDYVDDEEFASLGENFNNHYYELEDLNDTIKTKFDEYADSLRRLEEINERLYVLHGLRKKYGYTSKDIIDKYNEILLSIDNIANFDTKKQELENKKNAIERDLLKLCNDITKVRKEGAKALENALNQELADLYLNNAKFKVDFASLDTFSRDGLDKITFMLSANVGSPFLNLSKTASLGETSRLNLALRTVFNALEPKETIIFDEIDIGISGKVGIAVAKKMKEIALVSQVITISHLPQVSAYAQNHYFVEKEVHDNQTYSTIRLLTNEERIKQLAFMLNGKEDASSLALAKELLSEGSK